MAQAVRELLATFKSHERRCVLAAPAGEIVCRPFHLSPGMRRTEAYRAAALEADVLAPWSAAERSVALDPLPNLDGGMLLSIARRAAAREPRRRGAGGRAQTDCRRRSRLRLAPRRHLRRCRSRLPRRARRFDHLRGTVGPTQLFAPRLVADRLAAQVRAAFVDARRSGFADVQRVAIAGDADRSEAIGELLQSDGYAIVKPCVGELESPTWLFAYGLATWASTSYGARRCMMRANLLPRSASEFALFGLSLDGERLRQGLIALTWVALTAATATGIELLRLHRLERELTRQSAIVVADEMRRARGTNACLRRRAPSRLAQLGSLLRESGNDVALQIARVGNAIPPGMWLDRLSWDSANRSAERRKFIDRGSRLDCRAARARLPERPSNSHRFAPARGRPVHLRGRAGVAR